MLNVVHHQVVHAASETVTVSQSASTLPPWVQEPVFLSFAVCFVVFTALMVRHRIRLHRQGERFTKSKTKPAELIGGLLVMGALFYFRDRYPIIRLILEWPDRIPYYHQHAMAIWIGFFAASVAARMVSAMYAALFLRGSGSRGGSGIAVGVMAGRHTLLPDPPPGYGWFSSPEHRQRITRTRIIEEE